MLAGSPPGTRPDAYASPRRGRRCTRAPPATTWTCRACSIISCTVRASATGPMSGSVERTPWVARISASTSRRGVADPDPHHEPVELRLGERVGALVLDRVLGGDDHEGRPELVGVRVDRDLPLLHALEQRGLGLRARAVDLVAEHDVREDRAGLELEVPALLVEHVHAGDVGGQEVGRELDPAERAVDRAGDRPWRASSCRRRGRPRSGRGPRRPGRSSASRISTRLPLYDLLDVRLDLAEPLGEPLPVEGGLSSLQARPPGTWAGPSYPGCTSKARPPVPSGDPAHRATCAVSTATTGGAGRWKAAGPTLAAGRPARPLVRCSRRPSNAAHRRLRGLHPCDSADASIVGNGRRPAAAGPELG